MSKKFKSQASSARAASAAFGSSSFGFGSPSAGFQTAPSSLSYIAEQPGLTSIADPHLVVALRNLSKKDSVTKAKALEELQEYVSSTASTPAIDAGLLEAWVSLYPRTSVDNARRVRLLAHTLQGSLTVLSGKRIAPSLPKVIGPWLSGVYDSDKAVARAAQESIAASFTTDEKRRALWKVYKIALLDYAEDAIFVQTTTTLSDERSTTPEDAEAKHVRVVGNAMYMLSQVIKTNLSTIESDQTGIRSRVQEAVQNKKLWEYSYHADPTLRRAACNLALVCAQILPSDLDWRAISSCFIGKALYSSQIGSSGHFSEVLLALTSSHPEIWTVDYTSKTSATKRLFQYLRHGSQRGSASFWTNVALLLRKMPSELWTEGKSDDSINLQTINDLVEALRAGVTSTDEPRQNLDVAWSVYVDLSFWFIEKIGQEESRSTFLSQRVLPLPAQYVVSDPQQTLWAMPASIGAKISGTVLVELIRHGLKSSFDTAWRQLCQHLVNGMKMSLPESSKDFTKSQDGVVAQSKRLLALKAFVLQADQLDASGLTFAKDVFQRSDGELVVAATELLKSRNGKPYGAACVLESVSVGVESSDSLQVLTQFLLSDALDLLTSPSAEYMMVVVLRMHQDLGPAVARLIDARGNVFAAKALENLLREISEPELSKLEELQTFVLQKISQDFAVEATQSMAKSLFKNANLQSSRFRGLCDERILSQLSPESPPHLHQAILRFLTSLLTDSRSRSSVLSEELGNGLLSKLLLLSDADDSETAELATSLVPKLKMISSGSGSTAASSTAVVADQLSGKGTPLGIFVLIDLAKDTLRDAPSGGESELITSIIPSEAQWENALKPNICSRRPLSLTITSILHGVLFLVRDQTTGLQANDFRDADEFSLLFRLVLYATKIVGESNILDRFSADQLRILYYYYPLALQLVNEKLTMESANDIWLNTSHEVTDEAADLLSQGNALIQRWIGNEATVKSWIKHIRSITNSTYRSYLHGLTFTDIATRFVDEHGPGLLMSSFEAELKDAHRSSDVVLSASLICSCRDQLGSSQQGRKLLNEVIAACTDIKASAVSTSGLRSLALLDLLLNGDAEPLEAIPTQRMVFLMQALVRLLDVSSENLGLETLAVKILDPVLCMTRDIYGEHWEQIIEYLNALWRREHDLDDGLPLIHASLRLYGRLKSVASAEDINEDFADAWKAGQPALEEGLLLCLQIFNIPGAQTNQPRRITAEVLRRHLAQVSARHDPKLYALLSSADNAIRGAAYDLLHRSIPAEQEQVSIDVALEKKAAHLPEELLSLLKDTPGMTHQAGSVLRQSYLLSWDLVFDHFTSSYKVQEMYMADIKNAGILSGLLELICEICAITSGRPHDASKVDFTSLEYGSADTEEQEEQRLSMHLYYCCLLYLPSLTRSWFIEQKNRVKSPLESWTQRYFSPTLVLAATRTVTEWAASQSQEDTEAAVNVKASLSGFETVASIAIDPESPPISIAISLPSAYPLDSPTVASRTRVGVSDKNWQSWLRTFQIIIFSTGSIIEGLIAFRRNVQGALKGQSECAICYSIIGTDMQTPNKRCGTCRNTFHGNCLFRWFKSSNSSSCPLCRNNFNYA
ncbi:hypothetical protein LTR92_009238 [Exophiala xenobiotica]|nr:hypothetical protein LTR92_009238 [Exophiala xenobiotica]KAK5554012.1 hypothetical protein LTR46_008119 [Exophiala xenobiotica]